MNHMNRNNNSSGDSLPEKIKSLVSELIELSKQLKEAIIRRKTNTIWEILAKQQEKVAQFDQYKAVWVQIISDVNMKSEKIENSKDEINSEIKKLHTVNKCNTALIHSFLAAIRKAMRHAEAKTTEHNPVYTSSGKMKIKSASRIINSIG